jgi:hypothetical protein
MVAIGKNAAAQRESRTENHAWLSANKPHEATNFDGPVGFLELAASTMDSVLHRDNDYCSSCTISANQDRRT